MVPKKILILMFALLHAGDSIYGMQSSFDNLYHILEVDEAASSGQLKKAYYKLAKQYHPDKNQNNPEAEEKFKIFSVAYEILSDKDKKKVYDYLLEQIKTNKQAQKIGYNAWKNYEGGWSDKETINWFEAELATRLSTRKKKERKYKPDPKPRAHKQQKKPHKPYDFFNRERQRARAQAARQRKKQAAQQRRERKKKEQAYRAEEERRDREKQARWDAQREATAERLRHDEKFQRKMDEHIKMFKKVDHNFKLEQAISKHNLAKVKQHLPHAHPYEKNDSGLVPLVQAIKREQQARKQESKEIFNQCRLVTLAVASNLLNQINKSEYWALGQELDKYGQVDKVFVVNNLRNEKGNLLLVQVAKQPIVLGGIISDATAIIEVLMDAGFDMHAHKNEDGLTIMHQAVKENKDNENNLVKLAYSKNRNSINVRADNGDTLLHTAARYNNIEITKYLMHKLDIVMTNNEQKTALEVALEKKHTEIKNLIIKQITALLIQAGRTDNLKSFQKLVPQANPELCAFILHESMQPLQGNTLLHAAAKLSAVECLKYLLDLKIEDFNLDVRNEQGLRPIALAEGKAADYLSDMELDLLTQHVPKKWRMSDYESVPPEQKKAATVFDLPQDFEAGGFEKKVSDLENVDSSLVAVKKNLSMLAGMLNELVK